MSAQLQPSRKGDWILTYSGVEFWPLDARPEEILIEDIAHALSMTCRYGGHVKEFYSVAQHSVLVSKLVPAKDALWGLLHDASEAYICDLPRPVKRQIAQYKEIEDDLLGVIARRFGLDPTMPPSVKEIDNRILADESMALFDPVPDWIRPYKPTGIMITPLAPGFAEQVFLARYKELQNGQ